AGAVRWWSPREDGPPGPGPSGKDKENKELADGPLEVEGGVEPDVFVRPPKGVSLRPEENRYMDRFHVYRGTSDVAFVYLCVGKDKPEDFRSRVLLAFGRGTSSKMTTAPWGREGVPLDTVTVQESNKAPCFVY